MIMKDVFNLYQKTKIVMHFSFKEDTKKQIDLAISVFYYLKYYLEDSLRDLNAIFNKEFFQQKLYKGNGVKEYVHYYQHHIISFFSNLGFSKKLIDKLNKNKFTRYLIEGNLDDFPRNKIHHFHEDVYKLKNNGFVIQGLNVIFDESQIHLRNIKDPNRLLDLLENKYYYFNDEYKIEAIDLMELKSKVNKIYKQVCDIDEFIHVYWLTEK